jgi:outer membrane protein W
VKRTHVAWAKAALVLALAAAPMLSAAAARAADSFGLNSSWISFRLGTASSSADNAPDPGWAGGVGYTRMIGKRLSVGFTAEAQLVGRYGAASNIEIPAVLDFLVHFKWGATMRPYIGPGFGVVYQKLSRTGEDYTEVQPTGYLRGGLDMPLSDRTLIGFDARLASVSTDRITDDPVFGTASPSSGRFGFYVTMSRVLAR